VACGFGLVKEHPRGDWHIGVDLASFHLHAHSPRVYLYDIIWRSWLAHGRESSTYHSFSVCGWFLKVIVGTSIEEI
jgi:hypothetical protein